MIQEKQYLVLPLRDIVVMPHSFVSLFVGRPKSVQVLQRAASEKTILLLAQKSPNVDDPKLADLYDTGTLARIAQLTELPDGSRKVVVEGLSRFQVKESVNHEEYLECMGKELATIMEDGKEIEAARRLIMSDLNKYRKMMKKKVVDPFPAIIKIEDTEKMVDLLVAHLEMEVSTKQEILSATHLEERMRLILVYIQSEIEVSRVESRILNRIKANVKKKQQEYTEHIKNEAIRAELGDANEFDILQARIQSARMPSEAKKKAESELKKLKSMNAMSSEAVVIRHYLDFLCDLPWSQKTQLEENLSQAEVVLDQDHYGLPRIKDEIIKHIAVYNRTKKPQGTVLCLVGPPGVGKTSLGKSIARATKRKFARIALGGVKDEAEIRGHRRTYIGSMSGKILQEMKKCGSKNPLFILDEVDKLGQDWRGDPASALLEVLDPEQNYAFVDHYLEIPFPLHECMFVCTANTIQHIPPALLDRMEVIHLSSYTEDEKMEIAKRHLVPKQKSKNGVKEDEFNISEEALRRLIREYTREAGVRNLDRMLGSLTRQTVRLIDSKKIDRLHLTKANLEKYAGIPKYSHGEAGISDSVGVTTGLAWTESAGELLPIEAVLVPGKGKVTATGKLGEVMKESVQIAFGFLRSQALSHGVDLNLLETHDIHIHVPEGATPKDGPSAGMGIYLSMLSALLKLPVKSLLAVTGEISLIGKIWPVGGIKEKVLAAHRAGIKTVLIPKENVKNLEDIPDTIKAAITIIPITHADEATEHALLGYGEHLQKVLGTR